MNSKMTKIGGKFFSPEWFDLDREGNMEQIDNKVDYDEVVRQSHKEKWGFIPTLCPWCLNGAVQYGNDDERGNRYEQVTVCSCSWCKKQWTVDID